MGKTFRGPRAANMKTRKRRTDKHAQPLPAADVEKLQKLVGKRPRPKRPR